MIIQNIQVKHAHYGIGDGEIYREKNHTYIKVNFTNKTITFDYQFAFLNKVLELVNPNVILRIPIVPFNLKIPFILREVKSEIAGYDNDMVELLPIKSYDVDFVWICDKQGTPQVQKIPYIDEAPKRYIKNSEKIIIFKYQLRVLTDTFFNSTAYTTQENWDNRLTDKFDNSLIGEIGHYQTHIKSLEQAKIYLISLGFSEENIMEEKDNTFIQRLGTVYL